MKHGDHQHSHSGPAHKSLGRCLKSMRQRLQETLGETSGAVEIAVEQLDRFERGAELPTEDILLLLINHFNLGDDEAVRLWELAGYEQPLPPADDDNRAPDQIFNDGQLRQTMHVMLLALDSRVLYTNGVEVVTDNSGLVLNFVQGGNPIQSNTGQPGQLPQPAPATVVSRVGMSYDQAEQLLQALQRAILHKQYLSGPRQLPPTTKN